MERFISDTVHSVSFVIPALNEEKNIGRLIMSINAQVLNESTEKVEVIVVDNGSKDKTIEIARKNGALTYSKPGLSIADLRNFGAELATGDIIIFSDADNVLLNNDIVNNVVLLMCSGDISALGPDGLLPYGDSTWIQDIWYYHTATLDRHNETVYVDNLSSGFFAIKTNVFLEIGGFNGNLSIGEDSEISNRLVQGGHRIVKSRKIIVHNIGHPENIFQFVKREYWHGDSVKHLYIHKNIDLLTIYFALNCLLWFGVLMCVLYLKSYRLALVIGVLIFTVPFYKALVRIGKINFKLLQLALVYFLYASSRSLALFKVK